MGQEPPPVLFLRKSEHLGKYFVEVLSISLVISFCCSWWTSLLVLDTEIDFVDSKNYTSWNMDILCLGQVDNYLILHVEIWI